MTMDNTLIRVSFKLEKIGKSHRQQLNKLQICILILLSQYQKVR